MSVWLKRIGIGLAAFVILLLLTVAVALVLVDTEAVKRVVSERVEAWTGRELVIEGDLGLSLFPWIGFELGPTRLANAPGFDARPFVALERAELRVRLLPLLRREVAVDRVVLHGLSLNLGRDAAGRGNWEDLVPAADAAGGGTAEPPAEASAGSDIRFRVEGVELRDANLAWRDDSSGQEVIVRDLDLETGPLAPREPTPVRLSVTLEPSGAPTVAVALATEAMFDPGEPAVTLSDLRIDLEASGEALPGGRLAASVNAGVEAALGAGRVRVDPLALGLAGVVRARGVLTAEFGGDEPAINGRLDVAPFSPRELLDALAVTLPAGIGETALQRASAGLGFSAAGTTARIEDLELDLDDTRATGSAILHGGDIPAAELRLALDRIDLDRYLPAGESGKAEPAGAGTAAGGDPVAGLPLESMRGVRALAAVDVGRIAVRGIDARNAALRVRLEDGLLTLDRLSADVADGSLQLRGRLDGRTDTPAAALQLGIAGVQSAPLIRALAGTTPVSGKLDADIGLGTDGATLDDWIGALAGRIDTTFSDGAIEGINIAQRVRVALARFDGEKVADAEQVRQTDFSRLHFAADVRDGVVQSDELDLRAPLLRVGGEGRINLRRRSVDYRARVLVTGTLEGQGGTSGDRLKGLEIPLRISGPLSAPAFELAFADAMEARAKAKREELKREAREAGQEAERKLEQEVAEEKARLERRKKEKKQEARDKLEEEIKGLFD